MTGRIRRYARAVRRRLPAARRSLDLAFVEQYEKRVDHSPIASPDRSGALLAAITFHFAPNRLPFLGQALHALRAAPFERVQVEVHTNSPHAAVAIQDEFPEARTVVHNDLGDPFMLTWRHRAGMADRVDDFDYFLYQEDDILIPKSTMLRWKAEHRAVQGLGFLGGFMRVELNDAGKLVCSDLQARPTRSDVLSVGNKLFLNTPYPYQACWIYDQDTMREFVSSPCYRLKPETQLPAVPTLRVRERAAIGLALAQVPEGMASRHLIPLSADCQVPPDALVYHMPCNYGRRYRPHPAGLGTIRLKDCIKRGS